MYAYIKGDVAAIEEESLIIENNGIGYRVIVPASILDGEIGIGDSVKVYTYFSVREDAMQLYGFLSNDDLLMFRKLLGVSGVSSPETVPMTYFVISLSSAVNSFR